MKTVRRWATTRMQGEFHARSIDCLVIDRKRSGRLAMRPGEVRVRLRARRLDGRMPSTLRCGVPFVVRNGREAEGLDERALSVRRPPAGAAQRDERVERLILALILGLILGLIWRAFLA